MAEDAVESALAEVLAVVADTHYINDMTAEQDEQRDAFIAALPAALAPVVAREIERAVEEALERLGALADKFEWDAGCCGGHADRLRDALDQP